ncbi:hypothetical protein GBH48_09510, partial [Bifidobacterium longum]
FVSVASGHLTLLAVGQVLQRSLEPATASLIVGGGRCTNSERSEQLPPMTHGAPQTSDNYELRREMTMFRKTPLSHLR